MSDTPDQPIDLKTFHCRIINDTQKLQAEEAAYLNIPDVRKVSPEIILLNYDQIKQDIQDLLQCEMQALVNDPARMHLLINKK
jgi:hypothetical protein